MGLGPYREATHLEKAIPRNSNKKQHDRKPEIYCITRDGRLLIFKLDGDTTTAVGEFSRFTRALQVWAPVQCGRCEMIQFIDLGSSHWDEVEHVSRSIDSGRSRHYGGQYDCPSCRSSIAIQLEFKFYASAGIFSKEDLQNANLVLVGGIREFFKSAKVSSETEFHTESDTSVMHFG